MHNGRAMDPADLRKQRLAEWIKRHQGARTNTEFAADISEAGTWPIDYSRLGRYRNGKLQVGQAVIDHFNAYAAKRGLPPVDLGPREAPISFEERQLAAMKAQTDATAALVVELRLWRTEDRAKLNAVGRIVAGMAAGRLTPQETEELRALPVPPATTE